MDGLATGSGRVEESWPTKVVGTMPLRLASVLPSIMIYALPNLPASLPISSSVAGMLGSYSALSTVLLGSNEISTALVKTWPAPASALIFISASGLKVGWERSRTSLYSSDMAARTVAALTLAAGTELLMVPRDL